MLIKSHSVITELIKLMIKLIEFSTTKKKKKQMEQGQTNKLNEYINTWKRGIQLNDKKREGERESPKSDIKLLNLPICSFRR